MTNQFLLHFSCLIISLKKYILKCITPVTRCVFQSNNGKGVLDNKRFLLDQNNLHEHKVKQYLYDMIVLFCECGCDIMATYNYFHHFPLFRTFNKVQDVDHSILQQQDILLQKSCIQKF